MTFSYSSGLLHFSLRAFCFYNIVILGPYMRAVVEEHVSNQFDWTYMSTRGLPRNLSNGHLALQLCRKETYRAKSGW